MRTTPSLLHFVGDDEGGGGGGGGGGRTIPPLFRFSPPPPSLDSLHSRNLNLLTRLKKELKPLLVEVGATTSSIVYGSFFSAN
jgi:hypothetical protein